jgi:hypothetical protein
MRLSAVVLAFLVVTACTSSPHRSARQAASPGGVIMGGGMLAGVALGQPTGPAIDALIRRLGAPVEVQSFLCGDRVPALVAQWGDLSAVFGTGSDSVHAFDKFVYNDGGWDAYQDAKDGAPPLVSGHVMSPRVDTSGGATVGDTVRQVQQLDPGARVQSSIINGEYQPSYLVDGSLVLFSSPPSGTTAPLQPTDRISVIFDQNGNC